MTDLNHKRPEPPRLTTAGRRVRSGAFALRAENTVDQKQRDAAATLQNIAHTLRQSLDATNASEILTPMERRNAATAAVRRATEAYDTLRSKVVAAAAHVRERVDQLDHVRRSYAGKVDAFTLRRLELRAAALREQGGAALLTEWREAEAAQDPDRILALGLADPGNHRAADRLFLKVARPAQLAEVERDLALQGQLDADAQTFGDGLVELLKASDPHMTTEANSRDLFEMSNMTPAPLDPLLPQWLHAAEGPA